MSLGAATVSDASAVERSACCGLALERGHDPVDGGSEPATDHRGYRCPCGARGVIVVCNDSVIRRVGPAVDPLFNDFSGGEA
jgi:hypothetical protein